MARGSAARLSPVRPPSPPLSRPKLVFPIASLFRLIIGVVTDHGRLSFLHPDLLSSPLPRHPKHFCPRPFNSGQYWCCYLASIECILHFSPSSFSPLRGASSCFPALSHASFLSPLQLGSFCDHNTDLSMTTCFQSLKYIRLNIFSAAHL